MIDDDNDIMICYHAGNPSGKAKASWMFINAIFMTSQMHAKAEIKYKHHLA